MLSFGAGANQIAWRFRVFAMAGVDDGSPLGADVQDALATDLDARTSQQSQLAQTTFAATAEATAPLRRQVRSLEDRLEALTGAHTTMVMDVAEKPRDTFVLHRGQYDQPLDRVDAGVPSVLPPLPSEGEATRLGLAQWLVDPGHPPTARVAVNRFWQLLFGRGLVATSADFGTRGALPTHAALLDWLAVEFVEGGYDTKRMLKTIVQSATYRQASAFRPALLEKDPENRLLARGPRFRLNFIVFEPTRGQESAWFLRTLRLFRWPD